MLMLSLDLEMSQPSGKIIQLGAVIGDMRNGEIKARFSRFVNPHEQLSQYIIDLTGITQQEVDSGTSLLGAYRELVLWKEKFNPLKQAITWGTGDMHQLRTQLHSVNSEEEWVFGIRHFDAKTIFQSIMLSKQKATKAGLKKAMETFGMQFSGAEHDAQEDALNTFLLWHKMVKKLGDLNV